MFKWIRKIIFVLTIFSILSLFFCRFFNPPITFIQLGALFKYHKLDRSYISYNEMGTAIKKAVIASEDQNYYKHAGFDFKAIKKALKGNQDGRKIKGGSTISQQTAKNVFLWGGRTYLRKAMEALFTFCIEKIWNKEIILERYLNVIEMGQGVFGVEAASQYYFKKSAKNLSNSQAAWIAVILPSPNKYDPKKPSPFLIQKHNRILSQMKYIEVE